MRVQMRTQGFQGVKIFCYYTSSWYIPQKIAKIMELIAYLACFFERSKPLGNRENWSTCSLGDSSLKFSLKPL